MNRRSGPSHDAASVFTLQVPPSAQGMRIDLFLFETGRFASRHQVQQHILNQRILVDESQVKPSHRLKTGQEIQVDIPPPEPIDTPPQAISLDILYEDEDLLVLNKPAGMVVHPAAGHARDTLVNALLHHCDDLSGIGGSLRPGIVHRLDKDTSGLLVVAKGDAAHLALSEQFQKHTLVREYLGLVYGHLPTPLGHVDAAIGRHPQDRKRMSTQVTRGKRAVTHWQTERTFQGLSLVRFKLETGRTHQIRVHMAETGHPLVGDPVYQGRKGRTLHRGIGEEVVEAIGRLNRVFLHAEKLGFNHPRTGRFHLFSTPMPRELTDLIDLIISTESEA